MEQGSRAGTVVQVNVSPGGVPKLPVEHAYVGRFGLDGDGHSEPTVHGGPHRAVCLFALEVIERLRAEGHPIEPGGAGENLTTSGIEWSLLPVGSRVRIGATLELEISSSTTPCATQTANFSDGNFNRILIDRHPSNSRMYARVIREGDVRAGDSIVVTPPKDGRAADELTLRRLGRAETKSSLAAWRAAADAGFAIDIADDGELAMAAAAGIPGPAFNHAVGLAGLPNLLSVATDFYDRHATPGYLWLEDEPWPDAELTLALNVYAAQPSEVARVEPPADVTIRQLGADEGELYASVESGNATPGGLTDGAPNPWPSVYANLARHHARQLFIAEIDGAPVANGSLHVSARAGWLRGALTTPRARGRGIQGAMIAARVRAAIEAGCDLVGAMAEPGTTSARNLERLGFRHLGTRRSYVYNPGSAQR